MGQYLSRKGLDQVDVVIVIDGRDHVGQLDAWQHLDDDTWRGHVIHRAHNGNRAGWFPADQIRADPTDYSAGR